MGGAAVLGTLAAAGSAVAASNNVAPANAGAGVGVVTGFDVVDVAYTTEDRSGTPTVTTVEFTITRQAPGGAAVADTNAQVWTQLNSAMGARDWAPCDVTAGAAVCVLDSPDGELALDDVTGINVSAYDAKPPPP